MTTETRPSAGEQLISGLKGPQQIDGYSKSRLETLRAMPDFPQDAITDRQLFRRLFPTENPDDVLVRDIKLRRAEVRRRQAARAGNFEIESIESLDKAEEVRYYKRWTAEQPPSSTLMRVLYDADLTDENLNPKIKKLYQPITPGNIAQKFENFLAFIEQPSKKVHIPDSKERNSFKAFQTDTKRGIASRVLAHLANNGLREVPDEFLDFLDETLSQDELKLIYTYMQPESLEVEMLKLTCMGIREYWEEADYVKSPRVAHGYCRLLKKGNFQLNNVYLHIFRKFKLDRVF